MDKPRKIIRSPSAKRKSRPVPLNQRVSLERVIGLTVSSNATLATDPSTGNVAYPAGCVVVLFNPRKNRQTHIFNTSKKTITSISFSPDGKHIVTGESGHQPAVRVWDVEERSQVAEFHGHKFGIVCVKFSPNMKHIVSMGSQHDMMVNVWNWRTGTKVASNKVSSKVNSIAFSHDGSMFVTVGNRHVKFWYLEGSKSKIKNETVPLLGRSGILGEQKNNFFCDVAIVDNKTFVITQSGLLCQFNEKRNLEKWAELKTTAGNCISAGEEYIFVGCANGVVRVFDTQTLHYVTTLPHPHPLGVDVASAQSPSQMVCQNQDAKFPDTIALVFNDTFKKVTCVYNDHSLYMWDVHDVKRVGKSWSNLYHGSCVWGLEVGPATFDPSMLVLPPGSFITSSADDTIRIWNIDPHMKETKYYKQNVYSHELLKVMYVDPSFAYLRDVDYNPAGGTDKTDTNLESKNGIRCLGVSPDGHHLASGDRIGNVRIHDLRDQTELQNIEAHDQEVMSVQYSNIQTGPSLLASSGRDRLLHIYDVEQGYGTIQSLYDHSSTVTAIKFSDSENQLKLLSSSADKSVLFRNAQQHRTFTHVMENVKQDWYAVASLVEHVLTTVKKQLPHVTDVYLRSDNAGCYHCGHLWLSIPRITDVTGINICHYSYSEAQAGKSYCDSKIAHMRTKMRSYVANGHDILSADDMKTAIDHGSGVTGCQVSYVSIDTENHVLRNHSLKNISQYNDVIYTSNKDMIVRKQYNVGQGLTISQTEYSSLTPSRQDKFGCVIIRDFCLPLRMKGHIKINRNEGDQENQDVTNQQLQIPPMKEERQQLKFECPEIGCTKAFASHKTLDRHLILGKHNIKVYRESTYDLIRKQWAELCNNVVVIVGKRKEVGSKNSVSIQGIERGYGLKKAKKVNRFPTSVKVYLEQKFEEGERSGKKCLPKDVEAEMRNLRDKDGNRIFELKDCLNSSQILSYFSRLSSKKSKV